MPISDVGGIGAATPPPVVSGHHDDVADLAEYLHRISEQARLLVTSDERAYDVAQRIWVLGMDGIPAEKIRHVAWPIW